MAAITIYSPAVAPQPGYAGLLSRLLCFQTIRSTLLAGTALDPLSLRERARVRATPGTRLTFVH